MSASDQSTLAPAVSMHTAMKLLNTHVTEVCARHASMDLPPPPPGSPSRKSKSRSMSIGAEDDNWEVYSYIAAMVCDLANKRQECSLSTYRKCVQPYLAGLSLPVVPADQSDPSAAPTTRSPTPAECEEVTVRYQRSLSAILQGGDTSSEEEDDIKDLCNIEFNLAYGGKILLHQTRLHLKRGHRYGLVGRNGAGKTTLMSAIFNQKIDGWPTHLKTFYVDSGSNVDQEWEAKNVLQHIVVDGGVTEAVARKQLVDVLNFGEQMLAGTISELSGGWQMKLRLSLAVVKKPDILLLDEPTNHLDAKTVSWLVGYLQQLDDATVMTVSHDTEFMEKICTDIVHYEKREGWSHNKLVNYKGTMSKFVEKQPQAKHYFELATSELVFKFPDPGRLEGIRTSTQQFMTMKGVNFSYPGSPTPTLTDINIKLTLSSRVAIVGPNGAGKTTLIKMLVGETTPSNLGEGPGLGQLWTHHNLRIAYVAQHSFHHVESHYDDSPCDYIAWRFKEAFDQEKFLSEGYRITPEEKEKTEEFKLEGIWSRRLKGGVLEYEIKKYNIKEKDNKYYSKEHLLSLGFEKTLKQADEKIACKEAGLDLRPTTTTEIQKHLNHFGLAQEFGTYGKIKGLSGGQKVKLVLAAAFWNCPHLIVLDEPTNYLDREALGALSAALNDFGGAIIMISHNKEFYSSVCNEEWHVDKGKVEVTGEAVEREMKAVAKKQTFDKELDEAAVLEKAGGNSNNDGDKYKDAKTNFWGKPLASKELRNFEKARKKGDVPAMRTILNIPMKKVMPGYESLGDGVTVPDEVTVLK